MGYLETKNASLMKFKIFILKLINCKNYVWKRFRY